jgi:hypothetical protein
LGSHSRQRWPRRTPDIRQARADIFFGILTLSGDYFFRNPAVLGVSPWCLPPRRSLA